MKLSDTGTVSRSVTRLCLGHFSFKQRSDTLFCFSDRLYTLESLTWRLNNYIADYSVSDQTKMAIHIGQVIRYKTLIDSIFTIFNTLMEFQVNSPGSTKYYTELWGICCGVSVKSPWSSYILRNHMENKVSQGFSEESPEHFEKIQQCIQHFILRKSKYIRNIRNQ